MFNEEYEFENALIKEKARAYFERQQGANVPAFKVNILIDSILRRFLLEGGFDVE